VVFDSNNFLTASQMKVNAQYIATFFIRKGWTPNSIAAMLGNMQSESGINFGIYESLNAASTTNGFGLVQWTPNSKYFDWANANGYANDHVNGELNRILWELENKQQWYGTTSYPMTFKEFTQSIDTPYNLAMAFLFDYERPYNRNQPNRGTQATNWYNTLDWSNPDTTPTSTPTGMSIGSTVTIRSNATNYATGETIPVSVRGTQHNIIQVRDQVVSFSHKAYLLDGIMSWVLEQDIVESGVDNNVPLPDTTPPENVTGLTVVGKTSSSVSLGWTASSSTDVASYDIYRDGTVIGNTGLTSYTDDTVNSATTYTYGVRAKDTSNNLSSTAYPTITITTFAIDLVPNPNPTPVPNPIPVLDPIPVIPKPTPEPDPVPVPTPVPDPVPEPSLYNILDIKKQGVRFYLAKPNLETIHPFSDVYNRKLITKYDDLHELTFTIPYKIELNHEMVDNPAIALVRERFVVKIVLNNFEEYFVINQITKSDNVTTGYDVEDLTIHCFHLPYELHYKRYKGYSCTSYNCLQVTNDALKDTSWKVGYISPSFNVHFRSFDLSSGNRIDFLNEISKSFNAIKTYDTKNRLVNFYTEDEISQYKGLNIRKGQYIIGISDDINIDNMATRLYLYGNNDLTINSISPNGQSYIEDFSYFLFPYEGDSNGNVIQSSNFMSDALCKAILNHGKLIEQNQTTLSGHFNQISTFQQDITTINNQIDVDNENLKIANDNLTISTQNGQDTTSINAQIAGLNLDLQVKNQALTDKNNQITLIQNQIVELRKTLILENYLTNTNQAYLLDELKYYIIESEFSDSNIIDATDLYNEGLSQLTKLNSPPVSISINLVDFLDVLEEYYNWNRLNIGDLVNIYHPTLGIKIQTKITQIEYDFENQSITLGISNSTRLLTDMEKVIRNSYNNNKVSNDYTNRKIDWQKTSYNFNTRNDRISDKPVDPTFNNTVTDITHVKNDDGSVTITVSWNYPTDMTVNANNIDGFNIYLYASNKVETITLGQLGNNESIINVSSDMRKCTIPSVPANSFYYIGVQAYRDVDNDIDVNGIILSNIVTSTYSSYYPYQPEVTIDVQGKLNGINYSTGDVAPSNPQINDQWTDTTTHIRKIYTSNGWVDVNSGTANSVAGYVPSPTVTPGSIPIRNTQGNLDGDITGSAKYLNGKSDSAFAQLDSSGKILGDITGSAKYLNGKLDTAFAQLDGTGKISTTVLPTSYYFASYTGDGTSLRNITLPFTPRLVRVFSTNTSDISLLIPSTSGGYKLNTSTSSLVLVGMSDGTPYVQFGKLTTNGFIVGQDSNYYGNKSGVLYWYEAFL
jgi:hypothetical protein